MSETPADRTDEREAEATHEQPARPPAWAWVGATGAVLAQGVVFGLIFGFLLQKGGVAKFDILVGVLLLENFVVIKVMLSAIIVGMIGVRILKRMGILETQVKETKLGANIIGGLIFGAGFGLLAYCPGTAAAAVGQGNLDAWVGVLGLVIGSYFYALTSGWLDRTVSKWGKRGKLTLPGVLGMTNDTFVAVAVPVLAGVLVLLEVFFSA